VFRSKADGNMGDAAGAADADLWTRANLFPGGADADALPPTRQNAIDLCTEYAEYWRDTGGLRSPAQTAQHVYAWLCNRFAVPLQAEDFYSRFEESFNSHHHALGRLKCFMQHFDLFEEVSEDLLSAARVIYSADSFMRQNGKIFALMKPSDPARRGYAHQEIGMLLNTDEKAGSALDNVFQYDPSKNTSFQNLILRVRDLLDGMDLRRAKEMYFKRVKRHGVEMLAFEEEMSIEAFVSKVTGHAVSFELFKLVTASPQNGRLLAEYLGTRSMPETPDLSENQYLRSFSGDELGRGGVIYDSRSDFAFEYRLRATWTQAAANVRELRSALGVDNALAPCQPPDDGDVAMVHIDSVYPFDNYEELRTLSERMRAGGVERVWRESAAWECRNVREEVDSPALAALLDERMAERYADLPSLIGDRWIRVKASDVPERFEALQVDRPTLRALRDQTEGGAIARVAPPCGAQGIDFDTVVRDPEVDDTAYVPLSDVAMQPRVQVHDHEWQELGLDGRVHTRSFVRHGDRFFRVDTGRTHWDVPMNEIDQIFVCQGFCDEDGFGVYALMGRTLYKVGEFDKYTITLFLEGIGGSGKTTVLSAHTALLPHHRIGVISANMQEIFGMGSVVNEGYSRLIICNEVSKQMKVRGEEWQQSMDALPAPYPRKYKEPWVGVNIAQHFWVGNEKPLSFRNDQGQVTRRLAGVMLGRPVRPRDASIGAKIRAKLAFLLRKEVLAYACFLRIHQMTDPMSTPDALPPAFAEYQRKYRRATDPMVDFMAAETGYVVIDETKTMLFSDFKKLYCDYRDEFGLGKILRWGETHYSTPFAEMGIQVVRKESFTTSGGETLNNVDVIFGMAVAEGRTDIGNGGGGVDGGAGFF